MHLCFQNLFLFSMQFSERRRIVAKKLPYTVCLHLIRLEKQRKLSLHRKVVRFSYFVMSWCEKIETNVHYPTSCIGMHFLGCNGLMSLPFQHKHWLCPKANFQLLLKLEKVRSGRHLC